jgi:hypothetical protein
LEAPESSTIDEKAIADFTRVVEQVSLLARKDGAAESPSDETT